MAALNTSLWRFFALSVTLHVLAVLLLYPIRPAPTPRPETIAVSLLPNSEKIEPAPKRAPRSAPTRPSKAPTVVAKKDSPIPFEKPTKSLDRSANREESNRAADARATGTAARNGAGGKRHRRTPIAFFKRIVAKCDLVVIEPAGQRADQPEYERSRLRQLF